jgi:uncharacterized protein YceH (UPF0502 family)
MMALILSSLALLATAGNSVPLQCADSNDEHSCVAGMEGAPSASTGSAMIQTAGEKGATVTAHVAEDVSAGAPLKGRVATLEAEMNSLDARVTALQDSLGYSGGAGGGGAGEVAEVQVDNKKEVSYAKYVSLLRSTYDLAALKDDVATLEGRAADLKSKILALENQVSGNAFAMKFSLLSGNAQGAKAAAAKAGQADQESSLSSRIEALEEETEEFRTRVTSLEQTVVGLQVKAE